MNIKRLQNIQTNIKTGDIIKVKGLPGSYKVVWNSIGDWISIDLGNGKEKRVFIWNIITIVEDRKRKLERLKNK